MKYFIEEELNEIIPIITQYVLNPLNRNIEAAIKYLKVELAQLISFKSE